ncbi:MAG: cytochrome B [Legionellaceae bacterium]|nr:cytochrome B [Legionellaceae bacterium]HAF87017.1 cytochrome B [Legionellales bacterium]HCA88769.1 cytochrome B [Legionellales bacterium]|tara:strand:- start:3219 stop:4202 length:984 start_codon:yes stop_codon:yes gene_type:complete
MKKSCIPHLISALIILAWMVVMLGAYTRLTDAGLGCPDWPGCYGKLVPSDLNQHIESYNTVKKAWTEMAHRYIAGTLAFGIFFVGVWALMRRHLLARTTIYLAQALVILVCFQAALGMWTVTLKLLPIVVMSHLLGGILIFSGLCLLRLQFIEQICVFSTRTTWFNKWIILGAILLFGQIALGGWVSANYAGLACIGFPKCNGQWWPTLDFSKGFYLFSPLGINYQGGILDSSIRITIQFMHRLGALVVTLYLSGLSVFLLRRVDVSRSLKHATCLALCLLIIQLTLGIMNVVYLLPLSVAVAHNGVAALLMATLLSMVYIGRKHSV